ncbi:hypothetical protein [Aquifex sp.]
MSALYLTFVNTVSHLRRLKGDIAVFAVIFLISLFLQFASPFFVGIDSYFHIKFSEILKKEGFIDSLPWLYYTIHREEFRNHHLLFHYLLIPFTFGENLILLGKIAASVFMSLAWFAFYLILKALKVPFAYIWGIILFLSSHPFLYRLSMLRVQSLSLLFLLLLILFHLKRNYVGIFVVSLLYVYLYDGFPLALAIAVSFSLGKFLLDKNIEIKNIVFTGAGILTGLVINPYFPDNILSFFFNIYRTLFLKEEGIRLGIEWYPYTTWGLVENSLLSLLLLFILVLFLPFAGKVRAHEYGLLVISLAFLFLLFKSRRFIEYAPAFISLAFASIVLTRIPKKIVILALLIFIPFSTYHALRAYKLIEKVPSPERYKPASVWLLRNTEPKEIVFNADWDDFPFLFFYNQKNYYVVGLDPMYMYKYDKKLYRLYQKITKGKIKNPSRVILSVFKSRYVFVDKYHRRFIRNLERDSRAKLVHIDEYGRVYKIE